MSRDFVGALLQLNAEKQVSREALVRALEEGIQAAYRRVAGEEDIFVRVEPDSGRIDVYRGRYVVDEIEDPMVEVTVEEARQTKDDARAGDVIEIEQLDGEHFGRIGAQTAKQIILQRIREVERDQVFDQFANREGELLDGLREPRRAARDHPGRRQGRGGDPRDQRAEPARALPHRAAGQGLRARGAPLRPRPPDPRVADPQGVPAAPVRARGPRDPRRHRRGQGDRPRGRQPVEGGRVVAPGGARPRRGDGRAAWRTRAGRGGRAGRREDRRDPVERGPVGVRGQRPVAGPGPGRQDRHGAPDRERDRPRADAVAGDRARGPERAPGGPPDRLADRHPQRRRGRGGAGARRRGAGGDRRRRERDRRRGANRPPLRPLHPSPRPRPRCRRPRPPTQRASPQPPPSRSRPPRPPPPR